MAQFTLEPLSKDNYGTWRMQMEAFLIKTDRWPYVEGTIMKPEPSTGDVSNATDIEAWTRADRKAYADIILSISTSELRHVKACCTSRELWLRLESIYQSEDPARKRALLKQLLLARMSEGEDIGVHLDTFFSAVDKLRDLDVLIPDDFLVILLLNSLPSSINDYRSKIESKNGLPSLDVVRIEVKEVYEAKHKMKSSRGGSFNADQNKKWRKTKNLRDTSKLRCHRCKVLGHIAAGCRAPAPVLLRKETIL